MVCSRNEEHCENSLCIDAQQATTNHIHSSRKVIYAVHGGVHGDIHSSREVWIHTVQVMDIHSSQKVMPYFVSVNFLMRDERK